MAETLQQKPNIQSLIHALDPISLILSSNSHHPPLPLNFTTDNFYYTMERGPRYKAYADLRESKLIFKKLRRQETDEFPPLPPPPPQQQQQESKRTPLKKQVKFQESPSIKRRGSPSVLTQSVPDFSATLRKENRKPSATLASTMELTPPMKRNNGVLSSSCRGSKSTSSAGEKRGLLMARKSYASVEELKGLASAVGSAINAESRVGRRGVINGGGTFKAVLGYKHY
ncbi:hypothetical protein CFOL_v3_28981 [Cephalotus follicularis]|uniref:Uncharacterized protein n=1 Tax=Cephalotus follicularis TaxID=3775 RepID=A0A1Q3CZG1_CEPFO|nr:hypothetical protein CFOL_v3_28981 [Cephalotus follicularis]